MLSEILPFLHCPRCSSTELDYDSDGLDCKGCRTRYPIKNGILDTIGDDSSVTVTPFQRLMQTPAIVYVYEKLWRRIGYYLASSRPFTEEMQTVLRLGKSKGFSRALDLACGTGVFTRPLAHQGGGCVVGLDLSWPMLDRARRLIQKEGLNNVPLIRASAFCTPFVDAAFPYVNCCGALHLFGQPDEVLKEIGRILHPGGYLCVQTTIRPNRSAGFAYFLERFIRFGFFNEDELRDQMNRQGFDVVESERHRISFTFLARRR